MLIDRRLLLKYGALASCTGLAPRLAMAAGEGTVEQADYSLRIATGLIELAPDNIVSTTLYNGQFPGPLLRFKEGQQAIIDIHNDTDTPELVHWHGQMIPSEVDGAAEEGTPSCRHTGCGGSPSFRSRQVSVSITPMWWPAVISTGELTLAKWGRSTSNQRTIPATTTGKSFS
jgi:FtsP/CotA-like multicopper oxidase with cupredoxin domain